MQLKLQIYGHVQGVWYRASTAGVANDLNLKGYAKNMPDGSVEILAIGDEINLNKLRKWCETGPTHSQVEKIEEEWQDETEEEYGGFEVL